jgi:hypothetical protein
MTHARQQIREAAATLLKAATPVTWGQVFETRIPSSRAVMPYLLIFSDGESMSADSVNLPGVYLRDLNLLVAGRLRLPGNNDTETVEDRMDALAAEVETKLKFSALVTTLTQLKGLRITNTEMTVVIDDQDSPQYAEVTVSFVARYATAEALPETFI